MATRLLIDAAHPEETRVVVVNGTRLEEFDFESASRKQLKGNIYLAKVMRVEPSLQAAFVDYGGNRHGFLAFGDIHPDYYQIPYEDRQALLEERAAEDAERSMREFGGDDGPTDAPEPPAVAEAMPEVIGGELSVPMPTDDGEQPDPVAAHPEPGQSLVPHDHPDGSTDQGHDHNGDSGHHESGYESHDEHRRGSRGEHADQPEIVGGDETESESYAPRRHSRRYKIQEVIKRRQVLLVQVVKEERGSKGAALTTHMSLAGRYCVLMPNTARGGGVSRKITTATDRKRLREIIEGLEVPDGMGLIVRTAGQERTKADIRRDYEYLLRMWDNVRELTLQSVAPNLVYEEASLIKRSIRDLYRSDVEAVFVEGADGYKQAKSIMKMLMPSHAKRVQHYEDRIPLFHRYQVEAQLDLMHSPRVQLRSGGYIVINSTEALVAIDVNSGRATRERNIEETASRTNLEAAEEVARQLRLRDLAGLIVIDFIDMEEGRNNRAVERKLKECLKGDRARIQVGRISAFGLLELSRQRLRPSLLETSTEQCPTCGGTGLVRSTESAALHVLRVIEDEGIKDAAMLTVEVPSKVAIYLLNQKRTALSDLERRFGLLVTILPDAALVPPAHRITREARPILVGGPPRAEAMTPHAPLITLPKPDIEMERDDEEEEEEEVQTSSSTSETVTETPREPRERRPEAAREGVAGESADERSSKRRRRGKRGGRRRRRRDGDEARAPIQPQQAPRDEAAPIAPHLLIGRDLDGVPVGPARDDSETDDMQPGQRDAAEPGNESGGEPGQGHAPGEPGTGRRGRRRRSRHRPGKGHGPNGGDNQNQHGPRKHVAGGKAQDENGSEYDNDPRPPEQPVAFSSPTPRAYEPPPPPPPPQPVAAAPEAARPPVVERSAPVETAPATGDADKPRRKGWWNFGRG